jgi:hypothetical protein
MNCYTTTGTYTWSEYKEKFDRPARLTAFTNSLEPQVLLQARFDSLVQLLGFTLAKKTFSAGETINLTLIWQSLAPTLIDYRAFVHVETKRIWGQHDDNPVCRLPSSSWRPDQILAGQFRVTLDPAMPPGKYPLTVGLYHPENGVRLAVYDQQSQEIGNSVTLTEITVQ